MGKFQTSFWVIVGLLTMCEAVSQAQAVPGSSGQVLVKKHIKRVLDGNTLELTSGERVRLLGVGAPALENETHAKQQAKKLGLDPGRFTKYGKKSKGFLGQLVSKKEIFLVFDSVDPTADHKDSGGKVLAYVYGKARRDNYVGFAQSLWDRSYEKLSDGMNHLNVNATMVQTGYGFVDTSYPFERRKEFEKLEKQAQQAKQGFWGSGFGSVG